MTFKLPIYKATRTLDVNYKFDYCIAEDAEVTVPAAMTHAILYAGCKGIVEKRRDKKYKTKISDVNLATAAVTLLYTDTSPEEGYLGEDVEQSTFALNVSNKSERVLSSIDFYEYPIKQEGVPNNKATRDLEFNQLLSDRVGSFSDIVSNYDVLKQPLPDQEELVEVIKGPMFHETFHHSEQAIMHYISSRVGINQLVHTAEKLNASYCYGAVLDIYSDLTLCCNCNMCLLGMQNSHSQGFLYDFGNALENARIQPRVGDNLMLSTRVSASSASKGNTLAPLRLPTDDHDIHDYDPDSTNQVLQAENRALGTEKIIRDSGYSLGSYQGAFFASKTFSKIKLEKVIKVQLNDDSTFIPITYRG